MVITGSTPQLYRLLARLVYCYIAVVLASVVALIVLSQVSPRHAPADAWVHTVIVAIFAFALPRRLARARTGHTRALRTIAIIGAVLLVVNIVQALIPGFLPLWMRISMIAIIVIMAAITVATLISIRRSRHDGNHERAESHNNQ